MQNQWENQGPAQQQTPPGGPAGRPPQTYGRRMWHIWGPFVIRWGITIATAMAAMTVYCFFYMYSHYEEFMQAVNNQDEMMNMSMKMVEQVEPYAALLGGVAALITIPVMILFFHSDRKKEKLYGIAQNKKAPLWKYLLIIVISAAMCVGLNNLILIGNLSALSATYEATAKSLYEASLPVQILCTGIIVPISEELVFRGLMFKRLREQAGFLQAAIYSSVVFGITHGNMVQLVFACILGMMLAYVYEKYGSVKAPVLAHVVINLVSIAATKYKIFEWMMEDIMRIGIITVVCASVAATMFVLIQRIEEKPELPNKKEENLAAV